MSSMCGRYVMARDVGDLVAEFDVDETYVDELEASYNIAPTDPVPLVLDRKDKESGDVSRKLVTARWGLVPSWSKDAKGAARLINARRETITEKPSFRKAAAQRRALVPADGYYEWQQELVDGKIQKIPTYLHGAEGGMLAFAALFENWPDPSLPPDDPGRWLRTCTIITAPAADSIGHIHDRTPLIVPRDLWADWLDPETTSEADVRSLVDSMPEPHLVPRAVGSLVNSVRNNGPELIEAV
ncbi:SOS response-associated peptidase [Sinomonas sp. JGH33]|uniref:Abasic site processing protein n=1 Tax=Sinomonas terricola TaxID=3110330 RepID=A0ABU5T6U0_9MICC|nr:SOS response-associated peptidase [Sinomonas sp. JGH33]MEA5455389.1 SOS response-associated peptidase [Sinomonas sp. JGH33]